jgi:hypothetical protein
VDAGRIDCPLERADFSCLQSFLVEPERAFQLPIAFDGCYCCGEAQCAVEVDAAARRLELTTARCPDPCDCDVCRPGPETGCEVPGLERGFWTVSVNGEEAFELPVDFDTGILPPPAACVTYPQPDRCGEDPSIATAREFDRLCFQSGPGLGEDVYLELHTSCRGCGEIDGICSVILEQRLTDDLPSGGELRVTATEFATRCDVDCPSACVEHSRRCALPPLTDGDFYRVWLNGRELNSFIAGADPVGCVDIARDLSIDVD